MNIDLALFVLRVVVGVVVMAHGLQKLGLVAGSGATGVAAVMRVAGFFKGISFWPAPFWAVVATLAEAGGGLLMVLGLGGPIGAGVVAADMTVVTLVAHWPKGFWVSKGGIEFPAPLAAGAFAVALVGNGSWSLDGALGLAYPDWLPQAWAVLMVVGAVLALLSRTVRAGTPKPA